MPQRYIQVVLFPVIGALSMISISAACPQGTTVNTSVPSKLGTLATGCWEGGILEYLPGAQAAFVGQGYGFISQQPDSKYRLDYSASWKPAVVCISDGQTPCPTDLPAQTATDTLIESSNGPATVLCDSGPTTDCPAWSYTFVSNHGGSMTLIQSYSQYFSTETLGTGSDYGMTNFDCGKDTGGCSFTFSRTIAKPLKFLFSEPYAEHVVNGPEEFVLAISDNAQSCMVVYSNGTAEIDNSVPPGVTLPFTVGPATPVTVRFAPPAPCGTRSDVWVQCNENTPAPNYFIRDEHSFWQPGPLTGTAQCTGKPSFERPLRVTPGPTPPNNFRLFRIRTNAVGDVRG